MGIISILFKLTILLVVCTVGFFLWINRRDSSRDERSYDQSFDPSKNISKQYLNQPQPEEPDPKEALRHYRIQEPPRKARKQTNGENKQHKQPETKEPAKEEQ